MEKHDEHRKSLASQIHKLRKERDEKLNEAASLPYWEWVKKAAREDIIANIGKAVSDLQSTQEYKEAETAHKKDLLKNRELGEWDETQDANEYFLESIHKLQLDKYSKEDCGEFLDSFFSKKPKLDRNSLYQFKSFCNMDIKNIRGGTFYKNSRGRSFFEKYIDVFSNISLEDLLMTDRVNETILDKINFSYDSEGFDALQKAKKLIYSEKWHDLTKKQVMILAGQKNRSSYEKYYEELSKYFSMVAESEIDTEFVYSFLRWLLNTYDEILDDDVIGNICFINEECPVRLENEYITIKELLDKYNVNYTEFCKLWFMQFIRKWKNFGYKFEKFLDAIQTYLNKTKIDWFIPKDIVEVLKNDKDIQLLLKNNAVDVMNYCDKVECDIDFSKFWYDQKFIIWVNPAEKKIKLFSRGEKKLRHHRDFYDLPESVGFNIVWWWWIRNWDIDFDRSGWGSVTLDEKNVYVYWSSEDFWWFQDYWGLVYRIIKEKFPEKEIKFDKWKNPNQFKDKSENSYTSHH